MLGDARLGPVAAALFLHGMSQGMSVPLIALWLVRDYHRGPGAVAAYFACTAGGGLLLNPLLGRISDRMGRRRPVAVTAALLQSLGLAALALRPPFAGVLAAAALLLSAQVQPPLFALINDHVGTGTARLPRGFTVATLRGAVSAAWMVGAPAGGLLAAAGLRSAFALGAGLNLAALLTVAFACREAPRRPAAPARGGATAGRGAARWPQLALFSAGAALAVAGNTAKMQAVPLYLARLGLGTPGIGGLYGWMAFTELVALPPWGALADRIPRRWAVALGMLGGAAFFVAVALVPGPLAVLAAFPGMALFVAGLYGVGLGYVQDLDPAHAGLAGGLFFAAQGIGQMIGGPAVALGDARLGLPRAFLVPGCLILAGVAAVARTRPSVGPRAAEPGPAALAAPVGGAAASAGAEP